MVPSFDERSKHWVAGAFGVLLVVAGIAPTPARAGCGHGVTSNLSRSTSNWLLGPELFRHSAAGPADLAPARPGRDLPCSGPSCSQRRGVPQTPAPSSPVRSDPWCDTIAASCRDVPDSPEELTNPSPSHPRHRISPPERPPRHPRLRPLS
jgi:hypothetical protein